MLYKINYQFTPDEQMRLSEEQQLEIVKRKAAGKLGEEIVNQALIKYTVSPFTGNNVFEAELVVLQKSDLEYISKQLRLIRNTGEMSEIVAATQNIKLKLLGV